MSPPTFVITHAGALQAMARIEADHGVTCAGRFEPVGRTLPAAHGIVRKLPDEPFIVINGSGSYHHETIPLFESLLAARGGPISYLQIDAHPDHVPQYRWQIACNSFVGRILDDPRASAVHLLGVRPECLVDESFPMPLVDKIGYYRSDFFGRFHQWQVAPTKLGSAYFPYSPEAHASAKANPAVKKVVKKSLTPPKGAAPEPALVVHWRPVTDFDPASLPDAPVYVSVDLDVARARPVTDWRRAAALAPGDPGGRFTENQGAMEWDDLLALIARVGAGRPIAGADFCGILERWDWLPPELLEDSMKALSEVWAALAGAIARRDAR